MISVTEKTLSAYSTGKPVRVFRLENAAGCSVELCNLGARWLSACVPDRNGRKENVLLQPDNIADDTFYMGAVIGRVANRIGGARVVIDGRAFSLDRNDGVNTNHGGFDAFDKKIWDAEILPDGIRFSLVSPDGENGFPGTVEVAAEYRWTDANELFLTFRASTSAPTCLDLTNHAYFNLAADGNDTGSHLLRIPSSEIVETDSTFIPTGRLSKIQDTPFDFTVAKQVGRDIHADSEQLRWNRGYNHCYVLKHGHSTEMKEAARLTEPRSGRELTIFTDHPSVLFYSAGYYTTPQAAVCLETQNWPDAVSNPGFPSSMLRPGENYVRHTVYRFDVIHQ